MCSKSGRGFVFSIEAAVALLCFFAFIATLSMISFEEYSDVVLYKQTADYAQIAMKNKWENNETNLTMLAEKLGRKRTGEKCATVIRTAVTPEMDYETVVFSLCAS